MQVSVRLSFDVRHVLVFGRVKYLSAEQLCRFQFALALITGTYLLLAESNLLESALLLFATVGH